MLHRLHRISAIIIGSYALIHVLNHLMALRGVDRHIAFMQSVRQVLRIPLIEALLLACVVFQVGSGVVFVTRRWGQRHGVFDRLQALSGAYLALFLFIHVSSVLFGRFVLRLDTNFYFAAAGLHISPFQAFFIPYYGMAVIALLVHIACAFHYLGRTRFSQYSRDRIGYLGVAGGFALAVVIISTFSGAFYAIEIPPEYQKTFRQAPG